MGKQGIRALIASASSVLAIGLVVSLGTQPSEFSTVPTTTVVRQPGAFSGSTVAPSLPSSGVDSMVLPQLGEAARGADAATASSATSRVPEEAPGEDTFILTVPTVVPTAPIPSVAPTVAEPGAGTLLSMPLKGRKTSRFGTRFHPIKHVWKLHSGLDLAAPCGTPVGAAAAGTVTKAGWAGGNGTQVKVDHGTIAGRKVVTTYNHLSAIGVSVGQKVGVHQGVGRVGNTGFSTGCHLHFEVIADGKFTDPEPWLNGSSVVVDTVGMGVGGPVAPGAPGTTAGTPTTTITPPTVAAPSTATSVTPPTIEPVTPPAVVPPTTEPVVPPTTDPVVPPTTEPVVPPTTEPVVPPTTEPVIPPTTKPVVPPTTEPVVPPTTEPVVPPTTEPVVPPTTEPVIPPTTEPVIPPTTEPVIPPTTKPVTPPSKEESVAPSTTKPVTPPTKEESVTPPTQKVSVTPPSESVS